MTSQYDINRARLIAQLLRHFTPEEAALVADIQLEAGERARQMREANLRSRAIDTELGSSPETRSADNTMDGMAALAQLFSQRVAFHPVDLED